MKKIVIVLCIFFVITLTMSIYATSAMPAFNWKAYESEHFILFYYEGYESQAQETLYHMEKSLPRIEKLTGNTRDFKIRVILQNVGLDSNGYAQPWSNKIALFTSRPTPSSSLGGTYESWLRLVSGHELTHIKQMNNHSGAGAVLPKLFGDIFSPNFFVPNWQIEGITVYYESSLSPYEGRLNDGYYDAIIAVKAQADQLPGVLEANYAHSYFPVGQWYLYGGAFFRYLSEIYGEDSLTAFFNRQGQHPFAFIGAITPSLGVDLSAKKNFGKTFDKLFEEWKDAERIKHQNWQMDGEVMEDSIATNGYVRNLYAYQDKLYYTEVKVINPAPYIYHGIVDIIEYDPTTKSKQVLKKLTSDIPTKFHILDDKLYFLGLQMAGGFANVDQGGSGLTGVLYEYDLNTKNTEKLITDEIKAFIVLDSGQIIYCIDNKDTFGADIWSYTDGQKVKLGEINQSIAEMIVYNDKLIIVSRPQIGSWNINYLNLNDSKSNIEIEPIIQTPWNENSILIQGDTLYYSANYEHQYAMYKYDLLSKELTRLTQGGFATNGVIIDNMMYYKGITADGEAIFKAKMQSLPYHLPAPEFSEEVAFTEFAKSLHEVSALKQNLSYLLMPTNRLFPSFLTGTDGLGLINYTISYSTYRSLDINLKSSILMPIQIALNNYVIDENHNRTSSLNIEYPLSVPTNYGKADLTLGGYTNFTDTQIGYVDADFYQNRHNLYLGIQGDINNGGTNTDLSYNYYFDTANFVIKGSSFKHFNRQIMERTPTPLLTGQAQGITVSVDYTKKLAEVNRGIWETTLYLSNIYGTIYADYTSLDPDLTTLGYELSAELNMGFVIPNIPKVRVGVNLQGDTTWDLGMNLNF